MKKLLAMLLFAFLLGGYASAEQSAYVVDEAATAAAPWKVGEVVVEGKGNVYRRFLGVTTQGYYVVQEFYQPEDVKSTDPYWLVDQKDVVVPVMNGSSINGLLVGWHVTGEKKLEVMFENGLIQGFMRAWYPNGQKLFEILYQDGKPQGKAMSWHENGQKREEGSFQMGEKVGIWWAWDERGSLIDEEDYGLVK